MNTQEIMDRHWELYNKQLDEWCEKVDFEAHEKALDEQYAKIGEIKFNPPDDDYQYCYPLYFGDDEYTYVRCAQTRPEDENK